MKLRSIEDKKKIKKPRLKPKKKEHNIDIEQAKRFLNTIQPNGDEFTFQTFDDSSDGEKNKRYHLTKQFHGTLDSCIDELKTLNRFGAGIFVTINKTDLTGRKAENITALRSLFVDSDDGDLPELKLKPNIIVSSKNGTHSYWCLKEGEDLERFTEAQKTLIHHLNTDPSINDLPRVMRVPGFCHMKTPKDPYPVTIKELNDVTYTIDEVLDIYPPIKKVRTKQNTTDLSSSTNKNVETFQKWVDQLPIEEGSENKYGGRNNTVLRLIREGLGQNFTEDELIPIIQDYCERSELNYSEAENILKGQLEQHEDDPFISYQEERPLYKIKNNNIYRIKYLKEDTQEIWVSSLFEVVALSRNENNGDWGHVLRWKDQDDNDHEWSMPAELLADGGELYRKYLLNMGLRIAPARASRDYLSEYILYQKPEKRVRCVIRTGWSCNNNFILPDRSFGSGIEGEEIVLQHSYNLQGKSFTNKFQVKGTLEEWQDNVGKICVGNSRLILATSLAFTPPLLEPLRAPNCGLHLYGPTSIGKTTAAYVAGSVWGCDAERGFIETFRATANGLESIAATHNDALLILDEMAEADPKEVSKTVYMLSNGSGKIRASKYGGVKDKSKWRLMFLSTGETPLQQHLSLAGIEIKGGQGVRLLDVPADADKGMGIFENIHDFETSKDLVKSLEQNSKKFYGTPIRCFIEKLISRYDEIESLVQKYTKEFNSKTQSLITDDISHEVGRVLDNYILIAVAGELGIEFDILPWNKGEAIDGVIRCFEEWIKNRGGIGKLEERNVINNIRGFLLEYSLTKFPIISGIYEDGHKVKSSKIAGFRKLINTKDENGKQTEKYEYWVLTKTFRDELCKGFDSNWVVKLLTRRDYLDIDKKRPELGSKVKHIPVLRVKKRMFVIKPEIFEEE